MAASTHPNGKIIILFIQLVYITSSFIMLSFRLLSKLIVVVLFGSIINRQALAVGPLNSIIIAVGEWDIALKGNWWMDPAQIFPVSSTEEIQPSLRVKRSLWGSTMECKLSLAADGTFMLIPKDDPSGNFAIKGQWTCYTNPYCVTDRFYDQLSLRSYPREKITTLVYDENNDNLKRSTTTKQQVQITLNCRMWGKYDKRQKHFKAFSEDDDEGEEEISSETNPKSEEERPCGKLTHGTLVYRQKEMEQGPSFFQWKSMFRPVLASFSAMRTSTEPCHEGWIDKEYFGY